MNHCGIATTMEDLDDHMLNQILLRLPSCATVLACSLVNKRWCSLIYDPEFPVQFTNHKKKITTLLMGSGSDMDEPPWTFVTTMIKVIELFLHKDNMIRLITDFIIESPNLSLEYLPWNTFTATATFKDLMLCISHVTDRGGGRLYYITNPLTKQWVALPPCPVDDKTHGMRITKCALICQSTYNHTRDYKFRVVVVIHPSMDQCLDMFDLVVYCSEIGEWKEIKITVPKEAGPVKLCFEQPPESVVCNGIIYLKTGLCLVALDPFDVNDTCDTTLEARGMPPLPDFGYLKESSGQLFILHTPERRGVDGLLYKKIGRDIELPVVVWRLDLNQTPLVWETAFQGLCKGTLNSFELPSNTVSDGIIYSKHIVVHPYNDKMIYMYLTPREELVLCDMRTECITPLKSLSHYALSKFHRLEHQWWPTSVPACAMPLSRTGLATTTNYSYYVASDYY